MGENRGPDLLGVNIAFSIITVVTVALRCYTRIWIVRSFGVDDWLMVLATLLFMGYILSSNLGISRGTGQHKADLSPEDYEAATRYWWFCYLFFAMTMVVSKLSFAWFLLRIVTKRIHTWIIYGAAMCTVIGGVAFFFVSLFQCTPVWHYWDKSGEGHCVDMAIIIDLAYLYSVFSVVTDFTFAILPGFVVWQLNLQRRARMTLILLIAMGCMASSAVVVRFPFLKAFLDPDFLWATIDLAIWSTVEMGLGITAASLSTLRPLIKAIGWKFGLSSQRTQQYDLTGRPSQATNDQRKSNPLSKVYIRSEVSQNASRHDSKRGWDLGTKVTAYAGHSKIDDIDAASTESCERLARTTTTNSASLAEEGKVIPQYYLQ